MCHFINRGKKLVPQRLQLLQRQDIQLWIKLLQQVKSKVVPINNIIYNAPTLKLCNDAYKYGIGVYNEKGLAWFWHISQEIHVIFMINLL